MIKWIVICVLGLIILGYLGFDIRKAIEAPATKTNLEYAKEAVYHVWTKYLSSPTKFLWKEGKEFFIKYVWEPIVEKLNNNIEENKKDDTKKLKSATST